MSEKMWSLAAFRFDDGVVGDEVWLSDGDSPLQPIGKALAIDIAHSRGAHLIPWWPNGDSCIIGKVQLPLRWEVVPTTSLIDALDENLWFVGSCGDRDFLIEGSGHTFPGRMSAWCPAREIGYNVSLCEMNEMSEQTRYFVKGFLSGDEPGPPSDSGGDVSPEDHEAWLSATARFRRTGSWYGRWGTCDVCGCVLLPDRAARLCDEHSG